MGILFEEDDKIADFYPFRDLSGHLDACQTLRSEMRTADWGRRVASIPTEFVMQALHECWGRGYQAKWSDKEFMDEVIMRKVRSGEWDRFKTAY